MLPLSGEKALETPWKLGKTAPCACVTLKQKLHLAFPCCSKRSRTPTLNLIVFCRKSSHLAALLVDFIDPKDGLLFFRSLNATERRSGSSAAELPTHRAHAIAFRARFCRSSAKGDCAAILCKLVLGFGARSRCSMEGSAYF